MKKNQSILIAALSFIALIAITSCSSDEEETTPTIYKLNQVEGRLNDTPIHIHYTNDDIKPEIATYDFFARDTIVRTTFRWKTKLIENQDSIATLHLYLDRLERTNVLIYQPDDDGPILRPEYCYVEIEDIKKGTKTTYHPEFPTYVIDVLWSRFHVGYEPRVERQNGLVHTYKPVQWPGVDGRIDGKLINDTDRKVISLDLKFKVF